MKRRARNRLGIAVLIATMCSTSVALADDGDYRTVSHESNAAADNYPLAYAARPLTMPGGMLRATFDINVLRIASGVDAIASLNWGVAIAPVDNLEIGFSRYRTGSFPGLNSIDLLGLGAQGLITAVVSPQGDFGDIPFYLRYQLVSSVVDLALEFRVRFPTLTFWGLAWAIPLRIHAGQAVAIDTGVDLALDEPAGEFNTFSIGVPFDITGNVTENVFIKVQSGVSLPDITTDPTITVVPLGFGFGGSTEVGKTILDFFANFRFPIFAQFGGGQSNIATETWSLIFGLNIQTPVLF